MTYKANHGSSKICNLLLAVLRREEVVPENLPANGEITELQQLDVRVVGLKALIGENISTRHTMSGYICAKRECARCPEVFSAAAQGLNFDTSVSFAKTPNLSTDSGRPSEGHRLQDRRAWKTAFVLIMKHGTDMTGMREWCSP